MVQKPVTNGEEAKDEHLNDGSNIVLRELEGDARKLVQRLHSSYDSKYGLSTTSCQVYDTAWVAMITKNIEGKDIWLFPECFHYLLRTQADNGGWGAMSESKTVGVLETAAALLALLRHMARPLQIHTVSDRELLDRIKKATISLDKQLKAWDDLESTNHIAVEMIMPALLQYLQEVDTSLEFEFDVKTVLMQIRNAKLQNFEASKLYGQKPSSMLHSLEAFIGMIDFDQVAHHLHNGSMMASPSSTSAYLIHASKWDDTAEAYLRHVCKHGSGHGDGGIPGTYPTTYFEFSWVVATLIKSGFSAAQLDCTELQRIIDILHAGFAEDHGILGFAPRAVDVDDTAKALLALHLNGQHIVNAATMVKVFENDQYFNTFGAERDPSPTSNCHVLIALLQQENVSAYLPQIWKAVRFICNFWWDADYRCKDKWHLSDLYPTMLMMEAFTDLLQCLDDGTISEAIETNLLCRIRVCLGQAVVRTLFDQSHDGSWAKLPEHTCYAILTLSHVKRIGFLDALFPATMEAIKRAASFLKDRDCFATDHNWTSKVAYGVSYVAEAYLLSALLLEHTIEQGPAHKITAFGEDVPGLENHSKLLAKIPSFDAMSDWQMRASLVESALFVPILRSERHRVFVRDDERLEKDNYLEIIPFTWIACNNRANYRLSTTFLHDLMHLSLLGYQVDEFMEGPVAQAYSNNLHAVHGLIDKVIDSVSLSESDSFKLGEARKVMDTTSISDVTVHDQNGEIHSPGPLRTAQWQIERMLSGFVVHVLRHPRIALAGRGDKDFLHVELRNFLHAHASQLEDNVRFAVQDDKIAGSFLSQHTSFFNWVRTQAADHVACAYSFAFACCLCSSKLAPKQGLFVTVTQEYFAMAVARHLATMCRMYNDVGSLARDTAERNVNSMHFTEYANLASNTQRKAALINLAQYEHAQLEHSLTRLQAEMLRGSDGGETQQLGLRKMAYISLFCDVTVVYDELYVLRDMSSSFNR